MSAARVIHLEQPEFPRHVADDDEVQELVRLRDELAEQHEALERRCAELARQERVSEDVADLVTIERAAVDARAELTACANKRRRIMAALASRVAVLEDEHARAELGRKAELRDAYLARAEAVAAQAVELAFALRELHDQARATGMQLRPDAFAIRDKASSPLAHALQRNQHVTRATITPARIRQRFDFPTT